MDLRLGRLPNGWVPTLLPHAPLLPGLGLVFIVCLAVHTHVAAPMDLCHWFDECGRGVWYVLLDARSLFDLVLECLYLWHILHLSLPLSVEKLVCGRTFNIKFKNHNTLIPDMRVLSIVDHGTNAYASQLFARPHRL